MSVTQAPAVDSVHGPLQQIFKMDNKIYFGNGPPCRNEKLTSLMTQHTLCTHTNLFLPGDSTEVQIRSKKMTRLNLAFWEVHIVPVA